MSRIDTVLETNQNWVTNRLNAAGLATTNKFIDEYGAMVVPHVCADGRIPTGFELFGLPSYVVSTYRTPGAVFKMGWRMFGDELSYELRRAAELGCPIVVPFISHRSERGGKHNCAACAYDRDVAFQTVEQAHSEVLTWHEQTGVHIFPLLMELETDSGEVLVCGKNGHRLTSRDLAKGKQAAYDQVKMVLRDEDFPRMLYPLVVRMLRGNMEHQLERQQNGIVLDEHNETGIAIGVGYNCLPVGEFLRFSPFRPDLDRDVGIMSGLLAGNLARLSAVELKALEPLLLVSLRLSDTSEGGVFLTQRRVEYLARKSLEYMGQSPLADVLGARLEGLTVLTATVTNQGLFTPFPFARD